MAEPIITPYTHLIGPNVWLSGAAKNGWEIEMILKERCLALIRKGTVQYQLLGEIISANGTPSTEISVNKYLTNLVLEGHIQFITHPTIFRIDTVSDLQISELLNKYKKLVVKPIDSNNGEGVTTNLTDVDQVKHAIAQVKELGKNDVLIENHVNAVKEYRIITWKGKAIDIVERIPAFVIGDGISTIQQLIEARNTYRQETFQGVFEDVIIDEGLLFYLSQKKLSLNSVPEANERIQVRSMCNLTQGGETKRILLDQIHPAYAEIFETIYKRTCLVYCGLDLITSDVSNLPTEDDTVINELNGAPGPQALFFADVMENRPLFGVCQILEKMEKDPPNFDVIS